MIVCQILLHANTSTQTLMQMRCGMRTHTTPRPTPPQCHPKKQIFLDELKRLEMENMLENENEESLSAEQDYLYSSCTNFFTNN